MEQTATPRIGIFGGTFDPVHHGHLIAVAELRYALGLDRVHLVPNAAPPHKPGTPIGTTEHRLAMLRLAIAGTSWLEIDIIELERGGLSYTVDTLHTLAARLAPAELVFLMGEDSLRDLPDWHNPAVLVTLAHLGVATRPGIVLDVESVYRAIPGARNRIRLVETPQMGIASRDLRQRVADGRPISFQVPAAVERYIVDHGLYRR